MIQTEKRALGKGHAPIAAKCLVCGCNLVGMPERELSSMQKIEIILRCLTPSVTLSFGHHGEC